MAAGPLMKLMDALSRRRKAAGYGTYEQTPGRGIGHLEELIDAPFDERLQFSIDPRSSWDAGGQDAMYRAMGYPTRPTQMMVGAFKPTGGELEINPGMAAAIDFPATPDARSNALRDMSTAESARAFIDAQNAGAGHVVSPFAMAPQSERTGFALDIGRSPSREEMPGFVDIANKYGFFPVDTGRGMSFINNPFVPAGEARTGESLQQLMEGDLGSDLGQLGYGSRAVPARLDSVFQEYEPLFAKSKEGMGLATRKFLDDMMSNPEMAAAIEPELMRKAEANLLRDIEKQRASGYAVREDIQRARQILAAGGIAGLKRALESGAVLPAAAAAILLSDPEE